MNWIKNLFKKDVKIINTYKIEFRVSFFGTNPSIETRIITMIVPAENKEIARKKAIKYIFSKTRPTIVSINEK